MAEAKRQGLTPQLDIGHILLEAQHRWLRPAEICEILQNYRNFHIAPESPHKPLSGSLFLFDRKVLRYFRKDGHNWRKKKDGKTVKEAHERLKADSVDVVHCYYAHGEENENFQRRTYWMLEESLMHIVLVHYLEVKGCKASFCRAKDDDEMAQMTHIDSPVCSNSFVSQNQVPSQTLETGSPSSPHTSEYEDAESDNHQGGSRYHPFIEVQQYIEGPLTDVNLLNSNIPLTSQINQHEHRIVPTESNSIYHSVAQVDKANVFNNAGLVLQINSGKVPCNITPGEEVVENTSAGFPSDLPEQDVLEFTETLTYEFFSKPKDASGTEGEAKLQTQILMTSHLLIGGQVAIYHSAKKPVVLFLFYVYVHFHVVLLFKKIHRLLLLNFFCFYAKSFQKI